MPHQAPSTIRTDFPWKSPAGSCHVEGRLPTHQPQLLFCHRPPGVPEQVAVALNPPSCPTLSLSFQAQGPHFPPNFCSELRVSRLYRERREKKKLRKWFLERNKLDLSSFHLKTPHLGVWTEWRFEWDVNMGQSCARTIHPPIHSSPGSLHGTPTSGV